MHFSSDVERALRVASKAHAGQTRKGEETAYVTHPFHVALMLGRAGADDVTLQAALLHDVVEDCDGWTIARIKDLFGVEVAAIVEDLTEVKGGSWEERKEEALLKVAGMGERSLAVKTADKLHNMRTLAARLADAEDPREVWAHFSRGPGPTLDYARRLGEALRERLGARQGGSAGHLAGTRSLAYELCEVVEGLLHGLP
ncbi:MAG: HD domain-containing protein [Planctomycetota bacterium]